MDLIIGMLIGLAALVIGAAFGMLREFIVAAWHTPARGWLSLAIFFGPTMIGMLFQALHV